MLNNGKLVHFGMVVKVLDNDKVVVHAVNTEGAASLNIPLSPTGTHYYDCLDAAKRKGGKEWVPGKFVDGVPQNGTPIQLNFSPPKTGYETKWKVHWFRIDGHKY